MKLRESRAAAPKGSMTYAFTHMGKFLVFWPFGLDLGLEARIWASSLGFEEGEGRRRKRRRRKFPICVKA